MNKNLLLPLFALFILFNFSLNAQVNEEIKCEMTLDQILREQTWDIDHYKSEFTEDIALELIAELNMLYDIVNSGNTNDLEDRFEAIDALVISAKDLGMNFSMFNDDLDFVETLK